MMKKLAVEKLAELVLEKIIVKVKSIPVIVVKDNLKEEIVETMRLFFSVRGEYQREEGEKEPMRPPTITSFGTIPSMPEKLSGSEVCIIAVDDGCHYAKPRSVCMPHQIYMDKLEKLLKEGDVFIFPASKALRVKRDGKRIWIE